MIDVENIIATQKSNMLVSRINKLNNSEIWILSKCEKNEVKIKTYIYGKEF